MRTALIAIVKAYRLLLSPWLGAGCRFEPTCSIYAIEALQTHGSIKGSALSAWRIVRCGPWCAGGHDPVPAPTEPRLMRTSTACTRPNTHKPFTRLLGKTAQTPTTGQSPAP